MGTSVESIAETSAGDGLSEAVSQLRTAAEAKKCWACGCLRHALDAIDRALPEASRPASLTEAMVFARVRLVPQRYECLGCDVCYPAIAIASDPTAATRSIKSSLLSVQIATGAR